MQAFHIRYRNTQGTLMRIMNAASRRGLDLISVQAEPAEHDYHVTVVLDVNQKQVGQLHREWYAIADVMNVRSSAGLHVRGEGASREGAEWGSPHPPASDSPAGGLSRAALA
jgi:acetolactate synthase small subunit